MTSVRCLVAVTPLLTILIAYPSKAVTPLSLQDLADRLATRPVSGQSLKAFEDFRNVPGASDFAAAVLSEKAKAAQWSNAVFALGAIGDRRAKETLETFLRYPIDPLTGTHRLNSVTFGAKVDSLFAFGYMAVHSPDARVKSEAKLFLDLANGPTATLWREIQWDSPYHSTKAARNAYMVSKVRLVMNAVDAQSAPQVVAGKQSAALASR